MHHDGPRGHGSVDKRGFRVARVRESVAGCVLDRFNVVRGLTRPRERGVQRHGDDRIGQNGRRHRGRRRRRADDADDSDELSPSLRALRRRSPSREYRLIDTDTAPLTINERRFPRSGSEAVDGGVAGEGRTTRAGCRVAGRKRTERARGWQDEQDFCGSRSGQTDEWGAQLPIRLGSRGRRTLDARAQSAGISLPVCAQHITRQPANRSPSIPSTPRTLAPNLGHRLSACTEYCCSYAWNTQYIQLARRIHIPQTPAPRGYLFPPI